MTLAVRVDPLLLGYGDTFGTYAGRNLGDTDIYSTAIDSSKLNNGTFDEGVELNQFEKVLEILFLQD
jgi:hypothetical protein